MALHVSNLIDRMKRKPKTDDSTAVNIEMQVGVSAAEFIAHTQREINRALARAKREMGNPAHAAELRKRAKDHRETARLLDAEADRVEARGRYHGLI